MYTVTVSREFIARHFLFGGEWGEENHLHSHFYRVDLSLEGNVLDRHGYLADLVDIEKSLDKNIAYFRDKTLNELPDFEGLNPSIEHFARIFCERIQGQLSVSSLRAIVVTLWENRIARASYRLELRGNK